MKTQLIPAIRLTLVSIVLLSVLYPLAMWGLARATPQQGQGERITANGQQYYANIGQLFTQQKYFWGRPSAVDYNAAASGASNKGPSNPDYLAIVQARLDTLLARHKGLSRSNVPADWITASGSGLDPHISPKAAMLQVDRIAQARSIAKANLNELVKAHTEAPLMGWFGPQRVNVVKLNIALDNLK
ncbi:MAG: K(+)-transporting ATPase subunit C [Chitinophagaceae bacterium]|jgi:K+-transporting ATPase ATPase C chain|nr:K(+)-transporting ATPase subunit C [Chitinophagaceae bacterium]